ncbi:MAG TPA: amidohydrolase family protein [Thermomicrobiales bacterium]|jgi:imidazolonepropionase-like amidohydrolase
MPENGLSTGTTVILAGTLLDGTGAEPRRDVAIHLKDGVITGVEAAGSVPRGATVLDVHDYTVMPGLINMHAHTTLPGDGTPFAEWMALPDELQLLQAQTNATVALRSGVTTIRDCGGRGRIMFRLREAIRAGIVAGPRFVLCGRALTITGGHCHYFGGEADGPDEMRRVARQLLKEGADFIKIMASGGGTVGTYSQFPAFDREELSAAIHEAHKIAKPASCHCIATESISLALDAGTDHIEHCMFMSPDTTIRYDAAIGGRLAEAGVYLSATIQTLADLPAGAQDRCDRGEASAEEAQLVARTRQLTTDQLAVIGALHELGVPIVAGNDAGWRVTGFDDFYEELQYLARAGMTPLEAIHAATGRAAEACQLGGVVGTVAVGCVADLVAVDGDPLCDLGVLKDPALVLQHGRIVVDRR